MEVNNLNVHRFSIKIHSTWKEDREMGNAVLDAETPLAKPSDTMPKHKIFHPHPYNDEATVTASGRTVIEAEDTAIRSQWTAANVVQFPGTSE